MGNYAHALDSRRFFVTINGPENPCNQLGVHGMTTIPGQVFFRLVVHGFWK